MRVSKKHFNIFKKECSKWLTYFHLGSWKIFYNFEKLDGCYGELGGVCFGSRTAIITMNSTGWKDERTERELIAIVKEVAFHEICELFLDKLDTLAKCKRLVKEIEINDARHAIIRVLEKRIFLKEKH